MFNNAVVLLNTHTNNAVTINLCHFDRLNLVKHANCQRCVHRLRIHSQCEFINSDNQFTFTTQRRLTQHVVIQHFYSMFRGYYFLLYMVEKLILCAINKEIYQRRLGYCRRRSWSNSHGSIVLDSRQKTPFTIDV